jgi:hypothetical protein
MSIRLADAIGLFFLVGNVGLERSRRSRLHRQPDDFAVGRRAAGNQGRLFVDVALNARPKIRDGISGRNGLAEERRSRLTSPA